MADKSEKGDSRISNFDKVNSKVKVPKNVRQIGKIGDGLRIYVEDYVKTYTKQLAEGDYINRSIAVLVGEYRNTDTERNVFLYGAIKVEMEEWSQESVFTEETWTIIYEKIKEYFPDAEIVGWYYGGTGLGSEDLPILEKIQINNFAGRDKVLLTYDVIEKENNFYLFDGYSMVLQPGYYIYYEKNEEMQNYMVDHKRVRREEEAVDDHAIREMRTILNEKRPSTNSQKDQKLILRLGYAAGTLMLVVALIVGVTIANNSQRMNEIEGDLQVMKNNIFDKSAQEEDTITDKVISENQNKDITKAPDLAQISLTPTPTVEVQATPTATIEPTKEAEVPTTNPEPTSQPVINVDPDNVVEYTVKTGDTLASICIKQCGSYAYISTVKEMNNIVDEDVIYVGQVLTIPKN